MNDKLVNEDEITRKIPWFHLILVALVGLIIVYGITERRSQKRMIEIAYRLSCGTRLAQLGKAMREYCDEFRQYPTHEKWCDLLLEHGNVSEQAFKCPGNKEARCGFAMNLDARPEGPSDMVVLFDAKGGWNQHGGPELLTLENHEGEGCNVLFNDGRVTFVQPQFVENLHWQVEDWNFRWSEDDDLKYWLENMLCYHRFTDAEARIATGLDQSGVDAAKRRLDIKPGNRPERAADAPLLVLPYPGGRHPRIGFLEGAVDPQRETKFSVFTPWDEDSYVVVDVPEAIWSNLGLTFLAHKHIDTIWSKQGIELEKLEWNLHLDGGLDIERTLPNGIAFGVKVEPNRQAILMEMWIENGTDKKLTDLRIQNCVMTKMAKGFEQQTDDNKVLTNPYVACKSSDGKRWIITAWQGCHNPWANDKCPCFHSDPKFPDLEPGQKETLKGWLSFYEGEGIEAEFARIEATNWRQE